MTQAFSEAARKVWELQWDHAEWHHPLFAISAPGTKGRNPGDFEISPAIAMHSNAADCGIEQPHLHRDDRREVISGEPFDTLHSGGIPVQDGGMDSATTTDTVTISAEFTSDVQRNAVMKVLRTTLAAWQRAAEEAHKETKITITYGRETKPS